MLIADLALGACVMAAVAAVALKRRRERTMSFRRVIIDLPEAEYEILTEWAKRHGEKVKDYAKRVVVESFPSVARSAQAAAQEKSMIEAAFTALDSQEATAHEAGIPGILPVAPRRKPLEGVRTLAEQTHPMQRVVKHGHVPLPQVPPGVHPCMHLSKNVPAHLQGQCQGLCEHREQRGRPCYWAPTSAQGCQYFEPFMAHKPPPL